MAASGSKHRPQAKLRSGTPPPSTAQHSELTWFEGSRFAEPNQPMMTPELERRAAEMRARNLAARTRQTQPPPAPSVDFVLPSIPIKRKIRLQESLADVDFSDFHPSLKSVRRDRQGMRTDRDGLIDLRGTGVQIAVSPELIARAVVLFNAVLKGALERGWMVKPSDSAGELECIDWRRTTGFRC